MSTRQRILQQALELFATRGYDAVGVQEIATAAGVTKPPLYHHFGSKQGLLEALLEEGFGRLFERLGPALTYAGDLPLTLFRLAEGLFAFARDEPAFYRLQLALWLSAPDGVPHLAVTPHVERLHRRLEALFESAVEDHGNLRGHHVAYAITFIGIVNAYIGAPPAQQDPHQAVKQFMYGIYAL